MPTYADAKTLANGVSSTQFVLPAYTGGVADFAALKTYVSAEMVSRYGVLSSVFDTATFYSTSLLRDYVHRAVLQCISSASSSWTGAVATMTIASPAVASLTAHGFVAGDPITWSTTGALPTGVVAGTVYYVIAAGLTSNAFEFSLTKGGTAVVTTGSQSGTHKVRKLTHRFETEIQAGGDLVAALTSDVGFCFRYPATGFCATVAWQLYKVYQAFGYVCRHVQGISGPHFTGYSGSHVMVEVFIEDTIVGAAPGFIIQDVFFNETPHTDPANPAFEIPTTYTGLRDALIAGGTSGIDFNSFREFTYWAANGSLFSSMQTSDKNLFVNAAPSQPGMMAIPYAIVDDSIPEQTMAFFTIFPFPNTAHTSSSPQGKTFADAATAVALIYSKRHDDGLNYVAIAGDLRDLGYYVSGLSERVGLERKFLCVRLADYSYVTINVDSGEYVVGSIEERFSTNSEFTTASHILDSSGHIYTGLAQAFAREDVNTPVHVAPIAAFEKLGEDIFGDYNSAGVPASLPKKPEKRDMRRWMSTVEAAVVEIADPTADNDAWIGFTATFSAQTGTLGTITQECSYIRKGSIVYVSYLITIVGHGTGAGGLLVSLPVTMHADFYGALPGADAQGRTLAGIADPDNVGTSSLLVLRYDSTTTIADGVRLSVSGWYRAAS